MYFCDIQRTRFNLPHNLFFRVKRKTIGFISKPLTNLHYSVQRKDKRHPRVSDGLRGRSDTKPGGGLGSEVKWRNFFKSSWRCFETHGSRVLAAEEIRNWTTSKTLLFLWIYLKLTLWRYFNLMWFLGTLITVSFFKGCIIANISKKGVGSSFHRNGELQSLDISVNLISCAKQRR